MFAAVIRMKPALLATTMFGIIVGLVASPQVSTPQKATVWSGKPKTTEMLNR